MNLKENQIFTFWEPTESIPAYLRLCKDTWARNCPEFSVTVLDYQNLESHTGAGVLDLETLQLLALPVQKDAIEFAVLAKNGGIFMDMDTIVFSGLADIQHKLDHTEFLTFRMHMGFVAARPGAELVVECLRGVQQKLASLRAHPEAAGKAKWDHLGNSVLNEVVYKAAHRRSVISRTQGRILAGVGKLLDRFGRPGSTAAGFLRRLDQFIAIQFIFKHSYRRQYTMLSRDRYGFIAERIYGDRKIRDPQQKYVDYWFSNQHQPPHQATVIGLHNTWTPAWFSSLSVVEVLEHECLLSRTLRKSLGDSLPA